MIKHLKYAVTFPSNGLSFSGDYSFQPGITAVTGENWSGKSLGTIEMIRYGLFGKKALRGPAADYRSLSMIMSFEVGGQGYQVTRTHQKEILYLGFEAGETEVLAVGADAVNKRIIQILGFGLDVFDIACACNQKESERLTRLTPAGRKQLIDEVVGLTSQEAVEKACREEAKGLRREADGLAQALVVPVKPDKPVSYRNSTKVALDLAVAKAYEIERDGLQRIINAVGNEPPQPVDAEVDIAALEQHERNRLDTETRRRELARQVEAIPVTTYTAEEIKAAEAWVQYDNEVARRGPRPEHSPAELTAWARLWVQKADAERSVTCPKCNHEFNPQFDVDVEAVRALPDPPISRDEIRVQEDRHTQWRMELLEPTGARIPHKELQAAHTAIVRANDRAKLADQLADLGAPLPDRSSELTMGREINTRWAIYRSELEQYEMRRAKGKDAQQALTALKAPKRTVAHLDAEFVAARVYETQLESYAENRARFDALTAEIGEKQTRADGFTAGAKGLVEARRTLKAYLAPSLSRVASALMAQMTLGAYTHVAVDEDMNIFVNAQDVSTLSGAGATIANLALRLALGQVLVNRVFPVFIGDEIDSDMRDGNAQATAEALGNLKDQLKQIILISHKRIENADQEIDLDLAA